MGKTEQKQIEWIKTDLLPGLGYSDSRTMSHFDRQLMRLGSGGGCNEVSKDIDGILTIIPGILWISYTVEGGEATLCLVICGVPLECQTIDLVTPTIDLVANVYFVKAEIKLYLYEPTQCVQYAATACYRSFPSFQWQCLRQEGVAFCF